MKKHQFLACLLFSLCFASYSSSQFILSGIIVNEDDQSPVAFANIGILDSEIGTISNQDGSFRLHIPLKYASSEVIFSAIGFERVYIPAVSFDHQDNLKIQLKPQVIELEPVTIIDKQAKKQIETLGNGRSLLISGQLYCDTNSAGSAMAIKIDKGEEWTNLNYLHSARLYIAKNKFPEFKIRLRILNVDSLNDNRPGIDLLNQQIIHESDISKGWIEFDLRNHQYAIEQNSFYLMFEWILEEKDRRMITMAYDNYIATYPHRVSYDKKIVDGDTLSLPMVNKVIAGTIFGTTQSNIDKEVCYYRTNSFGEWKRSTGILSAKVTLSNRP